MFCRKLFYSWADYTKYKLDVIDKQFAANKLSDKHHEQRFYKLIKSIWWEVSERATMWKKDESASHS